MPARVASIIAKLPKEATAIANARVRQTELKSVLDQIIPDFFTVIVTVAHRSLELERGDSDAARQLRSTLSMASRANRALVLQMVLGLMTSYLTDLSAELSASVALACKTQILMDPIVASGIDEFKSGFRFKAGELDDLINTVKEVGTSIETEKLDDIAI